MLRALVILAGLAFVAPPLAAQDSTIPPAPDADTDAAPGGQPRPKARPDAAPGAAADADVATDPGDAGPVGDAPEPPMTLDRLARIIDALDPRAESNGTAWRLNVSGLKVLVVTDAAADRMRVMTPVREADEMTREELMRVIQANFDTALDARYAVAKDVLWAVFIHPLSPLEKDEFISGLGQVINITRSYGSLYSGGALRYGGGDSGALQRKLIDDLLEQGKDI